HGIDPRLHHLGIRPRRDRGTDEGLLSAGLGDRDLPRHGDRAAVATRRPVRQDRLMPGSSRPQAIALAIMVVLLIVTPFILYPVFLMKVLCFALFACAFNLLPGYVGLMSFGHAAFFGMGSYLAAWTARWLGVTPEIAILIGGVTGGLLGVVIGWLAIRRQGLTFAMITLALAQMVYFFCVEAPFTGGENGIQQVPRGRLF